MLAKPWLVSARISSVNTSETPGPRFSPSELISPGWLSERSTPEQVSKWSVAGRGAACADEATSKGSYGGDEGGDERALFFHFFLSVAGGFSTLMEARSNIRRASANDCTANIEAKGQGRPS